MSNQQRVEELQRISELLRDLEPECLRGLLRRDALQEHIRETERKTEELLHSNSTAYRLFDRKRKETELSWSVRGDYVEQDDCRNLDVWRDILTAVIQELGPDTAMIKEGNGELIREIEGLKNLMVAVATGGPKINDVNSQYIQRQRHIREALQAPGIEDPNPYDDLWQWYGKWSSGDLPSYHSRREYLKDLFSPLIEFLKSGAKPKEARVFVEPTGWAKIDRNVGKARTKLEEAEAEIDFQQVGLVCRETLIDLAQEVFNPGIHKTEDGTKVSQTDARRMLDSYLAHELGGKSNEVPRKHAKAALTLANELTHKRTASFRDAALCTEATASVVNIIAIISGRRDP